MNPNIRIITQRSHTKASERYADVLFAYPDSPDIPVWEGSIPIEYRHAGLDLRSPAEIESYLDTVYELCHPQHWAKWRDDQRDFWGGLQNRETRQLFDVLSETFIWTCRNCRIRNVNVAARVKKIKELGYTLSTRQRVTEPCPDCGATNVTLHLMVPLPRRTLGGVGYQEWTPRLREKIIRVLDSYDAFEGRQRLHLLPDHKFPEIRWEATKPELLRDLTEDEIRTDYQLIDNQRNQQKRECCRICKQTGMRPYPYGIKYYYLGAEKWPDGVPAQGDAAEAGCVGCGWYDLEQWRQSLTKTLSTSDADSRRRAQSQLKKG
jgi:hypothetical protein